MSCELNDILRAQPASAVLREIGGCAACDRRRAGVLGALTLPVRVLISLKDFKVPKPNLFLNTFQLSSA